MEYLQVIQQLDLEVAGDFILMASTLMQIKVKMLLPKEIDEKGEEIDPRADLVKALLEYKRYKEMTDEFSYLEGIQRKLRYRGNFEKDSRETPVELQSLLKNITVYDIIKAYKKALMDKPKEVFHEIKKWNVTIDEQIEFILNKIDERVEVNFTDLMKEMHEKIVIIVSFIALLELIKMGRIGIRESVAFNDFTIFGIENG